MRKSPRPEAWRVPAARAVLDTNVVVAGFLTPGGTPARVLALLGSRRLVAVYSHAILQEYKEVLKRPKFAIDPKAISAYLALLRLEGLRVTPLATERQHLPDPDDQPFIAAARAAVCPVVTGNLRHFPRSTGVEAISPAELLARLRPEKRER